MKFYFIFFKKKSKIVFKQKRFFFTSIYNSQCQTCYNSKEAVAQVVLPRCR